MVHSLKSLFRSAAIALIAFCVPLTVSSQGPRSPEASRQVAVSEARRVLDSYAEFLQKRKLALNEKWTSHLENSFVKTVFRRKAVPPEGMFHAFAIESDVLGVAWVDCTALYEWHQQVISESLGRISRATTVNARDMARLEQGIAEWQVQERKLDDALTHYVEMGADEAILLAKREATRIEYGKLGERAHSTQELEAILKRGVAALNDLDAQRKAAQTARGQAGRIAVEISKRKIFGPLGGSTDTVENKSGEVVKSGVDTGKKKGRSL
jgi:hypothetical protein